MATVDVQALAALARVAIAPEEAAVLEREIGDILHFVDSIQSVVAQVPPPEAGEHRTILREDDEPHQSGLYTDALLNAAPHREGDTIVVQQVITGGKHAR